MSDHFRMIGRSMALHRRYAEMYQQYLFRGLNTTINANDRENVFDKPGHYAHYFHTGSDALRIIVDGLILGQYDPPETILDFPSGSGRVTRHLRSYFPSARITACDLYDFHYQFCAACFEVEGFQSKESFDEIDFGKQFDLIFCGSLLTHLPADQFVSALRLISRSLSPRGMAVVTLHGRHVEYLHKHRWQFIEPELFAKAEATIPADGFGYVDYNDELLKTWWYNQKHYGVTLSRPHWTLKQIEADYDVRVLSYTERAWDNAQDVVIFGKPGVNEWQ
jgi:cyclopropane fatty-acyl-phospholipid synthase-like methyltransferase